MTVIAWDGKTLAADKRFSSAGLSRTGTKIYRIRNLLCGFTGDADAGLDMIAWVRGGMCISDFPDGQRKEGLSTLVVVDNGILGVYEKSPHPIICEDPFTAYGSGRDYAIAAMHLGEDAVSAVCIASRFESGCGNGVDQLRDE